MRVVVWTLMGLAIGWLAHVVFRKRRRLSLNGHLIVGALGGIVGGRLYRSLSLATTESFAANVIAAAVGAVMLYWCFRMIVRAFVLSPTVGSPVSRAASTVAADIETQIKRLSHWERQWLSRLLRRDRVARDASAEFEERLSFSQHVADRVAAFGGSWTFIGLFVLAMTLWMIANTEAHERFDPFPFILLNLVLSCVAALQAPVIMMSQNRQNEKDRYQARADYEINVKSEMEIMALSARLDELKTLGERLAALGEQTVARLDAIERLFERK
jgi:uncharacterized membrane protein/uncharacterized membrane protein YeaQ/YmgE (transglycosylase-associated protein family)